MSRDMALPMSRDTTGPLRPVITAIALGLWAKGLLAQV